jgi:hypothetical protein
MAHSAFVAMRRWHPRRWPDLHLPHVRLRRHGSAGLA